MKAVASHAHSKFLCPLKSRFLTLFSAVTILPILIILPSCNVAKNRSRPACLFILFTGAILSYIQQTLHAQVDPDLVVVPEM